MMMMLSGCASFLDRAAEVETRIIEVNCAEGINTDDLSPGDPPPVIEPGQDWRDYGERLYVTADGLHARLDAAHGALEDCVVRARQREKRTTPAG
jgi:hypothetical protein